MMGEEEEVSMKQITYIEQRVRKIEGSHADISQLVRDFKKDFHLLTTNLGEVKEVLKSIHQTSNDMAIFRQRYESNREADKELDKRTHARLSSVEKNQARVVWLVVAAVVGAVLKLVLIKA